MRIPRLRRPSRSLSGSAAAVTLVAASALLLTGCQASSSPAASASQSAGAKASDAPSTTPKASASPTAKPTPVTLTCDQVLTTAQLAAMVPPLVPASGYQPDKGSDAAKAVSYAGVACGYANASSGGIVAVSIAQPASGDFTSLKNDAITHSNVVPTYGVPPKVMGYFSVDHGSGVAQAFTGKYWVVASSKDFTEPGDASPVIAGVLANLPS
ncbi:iron ABC transporter ATP-binding protein [Planctomonas sp. JC2975]|uniref:iron ABC transporter ATP-binding protein n=1 Tax=Planctomonas sp. JC2975 TaxID=2729626 RepID=UPI0014745314|nr:iron ABC transporter ATP-binding protein [Planctomonas sp. JC2975]NNC13173.1 iron ABC transporter ATP-binding protein [Planctomonas sp. JC2975]